MNSAADWYADQEQRERIMKTDTKPLCGTACIMYALNTGINDYDRMVRCKKHDADCGKCIAAWLQEDVR